MQDDVKHNEWIEEEKKEVVDVPSFTVTDRGELQYDGLVQTERITKEKVVYADLTPLKMCDKNDHYFVFENGGMRDAQGRLHVICRNCPVGAQFIVGINKLENGKISEIKYEQTS